MTITNGASHQSVDDILASIRSIDDDQSLSLRPNPVSGPTNPPTHQNAHLAESNPHSRGSSKSVVKRDQFAAEASDFDLPAIFRPGHQSPPDRPNLLGRITDALKPALADGDRSRTVIRFEQAAANRMIESPRPVAVLQHSAPQPIVEAHEPNRASENPSVLREMPSFFDTRMSRMAELLRPEAHQPPPLLGEQANDHAHDQTHNQAADTAAEPTAQAPSMDDAAAQLLRPILKQWLSENMPKIVEKALRGEPGGGQLGGFEPTQPPRKTLR